MTTHWHQLATPELSITVGDHTSHEQHEADYAGIWQITSVHDPRPLFVPKYCGMNFEFISPLPSPHFYEPRISPTELVVEEAGKRVTLHQPPTAGHRVESWTTFQIAGPCHIDWTFRYQLHELERFADGRSPNTHIGFFFASYIHRPENKAMYVLSRDAYQALMWAQFCTSLQAEHAAIPWEQDRYDLAFSEHDYGLYASRAPISFHVPLFLGRRDEMAFAVMFEDPHGVVICHGMGGGGFVEDQSDRNPAWDFFLYAKNPAANPSGRWRGRLIYKKFGGRDDILREYQQYQHSLGRDWAIPQYGPNQVPQVEKQIS